VLAEDGMIDASDLRARLGADVNVEQLIQQADKNKDGKIDQAEFCELLKNM
jgi:Ca2+-binding EF-hand superfamily protein